ncbi:MAG: hypothetical protein ABEJ55_00570 [Halanaeroarchaeum sp.]
MTYDVSESEAADIASGDEFEQLLRELLLAATESGIDPQGAWEIRNDRFAPDWDVLVTELEKPRAEE